MTTTTPALTTRSIGFSSAMILALLAGRKSQTRRVMKIQPYERPDLDGPRYNGCVVARWPGESEFDGFECHCIYGSPGDRLRVREALRWTDQLVYDADKVPVDRSKIPDDAKPITRVHVPPMYMPHWASRIALEITDVRVQPVQSISEHDADAEGCTDHYACEEPTVNREGMHRCQPIRDYERLWDSINGKKCPWASNPWVWVITFKRAK